MSKKLNPVSPGVPAQRIGEILAGKRAISAAADLRLWPVIRALGSLLPSAASRLRHRDREGDAGEDQAVEGNGGAYGGCSLIREVPAG